MCDHSVLHFNFSYYGLFRGWPSLQSSTSRYDVWNLDHSFILYFFFFLYGLFRFLTIPPKPVYCVELEPAFFTVFQFFCYGLFRGWPSLLNQYNVWNLNQHFILYFNFFLLWTFQRLTIPTECPPFFARLMQQCWELESKKRPSFKQILQRLKTMLEDGQQSCV